jgi:hypothetical protein
MTNEQKNKLMPYGIAQHNKILRWLELATFDGRDDNDRR